MLKKLKSLIPREEIENEAWQQIENALKLDIVKKLAILPDVHTGYDLPIGTAALLDNTISPSYVGYDIGCGMCNIISEESYTSLIADNRQAEKIFAEIYRQVPSGVNQNFHSRSEAPAVEAFFQKYPHQDCLSLPERSMRDHIWDKAELQLGTLGSGNHFIEIGEDKNSFLSVTIHSGSRNVGYQIAEYYMKQGRFFPVNSEMGQRYLQDMNFAMDFAYFNRLAMMQSVLKILGFNDEERKKLEMSMINETHNHAQILPEGVIHRKGATPAARGQLGIIPANMRDGVYITLGLGNGEYLESASHGAGRVMSRKKARKSIKMHDFSYVMQGIHARVDKGTLDEAPFSYKDISAVLKRQEGIVIEVINFIKPKINVKG